jgi:hypothetical protein
VTAGELNDRVKVTTRVAVNMNSYGLSRFTGNVYVTRACSTSRENRQAVL